MVCEPVTSDAIEVGLPVCGRAGSPRLVVSTTVPVSAGIFCVDAMSASSCAGVFGGRSGAAWATVIMEPAIAPPATTTATAGTAHRAFLESLVACMLLLCPPRPVKGLRGFLPGGSLWARASVTLESVRVLVVEDERRLAAAVKRGLEAEGFVVDLAHDGVTGLHLAREGGYDSVVLDIMLPGMSGYRVCQELRAAENWVPVLVLSAKDGEYDQADALDLGADDYLTKPFSTLCSPPGYGPCCAAASCPGPRCCAAAT